MSAMNWRTEYPTIHDKRKRKRENTLPSPANESGQVGNKLTYDDYTVGIVCAMSFELSAVRYMLSLEHPRLPTKQGDSNLYVLGELSGHNAVIACLPGSSGKGAAAIVATDMERTFPSVKHRLLVGIGGGVPSYNHDIRLGDVVVSMPNDAYGGVIQYDLGKDTDAGFRLKGSLPSPHVRLRSAVEMMRSDHMTKSNKISDFISDMLLQYSQLSIYRRPQLESDTLFESHYSHPANQIACENCDMSRSIDRPPRQSDSPIIHYGLVASGDRVMKSARKRDTISQEFQGNILCFEMEAAGLGANVPYMVIRGISDYSDSHKCDQWQHYAAATAAASAKEILSYLDPQGNAADTKTKILSPPGVDESNSEQKKQSESLMESLKFDQIDGHQNNIKNANSKTCQWLLETSEYLEWLNDSGLDEHHGFLWIKGKPGTGKSTLMKFILANGNRQWQDKTIASFFFNARGQDLEKSTIGMYRSLLYQLLQKHPHLQSLNEANKIWTSNGGIYPKWSIEPLKELFIQAIQMLDEVSLVFFIDALDECYEPEIRDMISFFEEVSDVSSSLQIQFRACFSSRHYPHITIRNGLDIVLENQQGHDNDINEYIIRELQIGGSRLSQLIKEELQQKSSGIFLWVILVVKILNKEYDDGNVEDLRERLREIPADLHDLFSDIICRSEVNEKRLATCLQWVLFAKRPLAPEELYFAILSGIKPDSIKPWDEELVSEQTINRFILSSSKGLVGIKTSKYQLGTPLFGVPRVQFIHESVREFLLNESYLNSIWPTLEPGSRGQYHDNLKECCIIYINQIISYWNSEKSRPQIKSLTTRIFPFLGYCLQNIFYHANEAEKAGVSQKYFLDTFDHTKLIRLRNELRSKPLTSNASLLYLLAESNAPCLINIHPSRLDYLKIEDEKFGTPLFVACANGSEDSVKAFLQLDIENSNSSVAMLLSKICKTYRKGIYQSSSTILNGGSILSRLEDSQYLIPRTILLLTGKIATESNSPYQLTLFQAASSGNINILKLLIDSGKVDVNAGDEFGTSPLAHAAQSGKESIVQLLLEKHEVDLNSKDAYGQSPLSLASKFGHASIVKMLLATGRVEINSWDRNMQSPLSWAAYQGEDTIVKILLESNGLDFNLQDVFGMSPLSLAAIGGRKSIVELLIETKKVDLDMKDHYGRTPLSLAACSGARSIVELLLGTNEVDVNTKDHDGRTLLSLAASRGSASVVEFLISTNLFDLDIKDNYGLTPLSLACTQSNNGYFRRTQRGYYSVVKKLLATKKVNVNSKDGLGQTPLLKSVLSGRHAITGLLLEQENVDLKLEDKNGQTALMAAASKGFKKVSDMLIEESHKRFQAQSTLYKNSFSGPANLSIRDISLV